MVTSSSVDSLGYALAIHTASPDLGLALSNFAGDRRHQVWSGLGQDLSTHLHSYLAEFIQPQTWADLAFIGVAMGPGGFTGTRLGVVTARTLAQQLGLPLFGLSTLAAVAWHDYSLRSQQAQSGLAKLDLAKLDLAKLDLAKLNLAESNLASPDLAVQMPAHRGEIYAAIYSISSELELKVRFPDAVISQEQWQNTLDNWSTPYRLIRVEGGLGETAMSLLELAHRQWQQGLRPDWSQVLPFYGQSPVS